MVEAHRANQLRADTRKPLNCRLNFEHTSDHGECRVLVGSTRWATGGGDEGMLRSTLRRRIILIIVKLNKQIRDVPNRTCAGYAGPHNLKTGDTRQSDDVCPSSRMGRAAQTSRRPRTDVSCAGNKIPCHLFGRTHFGSKRYRRHPKNELTSSS